MKPLITLLLLVLALVAPLRWGEGAHGAGPGKPEETMFGHQFYPTPEAVIKKMLCYHPRTEYDRLWERGGPRRILEPSAGSGAIVDFIATHSMKHDRSDRVVHVCEIDPELNAMLHGKGHTVVGADFLQFKTEIPYDLILMNPPFDAAAEHIVHAWDLLDGELVALCNSETVRNPRGEHGKRLAQLIAQGGQVEHIGQPFRHSARPTDVEVALVRLKRAQQHEEPTWWKEARLRPEEAPDLSLAESAARGVMPYDRLDALVSAYSTAREAFRKVLIARAELNRALDPFWKGWRKDFVQDSLELLANADEEAVGAARADRSFAAGLQAQAWRSVFEQANFSDYATAGVHRNLAKLLEQQQAMAFDRPNIAAMLELLFFNRGEILKQAMLEVFDRLCSLYPGNMSHWEGWKTNSAHMVNRRVVMPWSGLTYDRRWGGSFSSYNVSDRTDDIDRAMAMLEGRRLSSPTRIEHLKHYTNRYGNVKERTLVTIAEAIKLSIAALPQPIESHHFNTLDNTAESEYFLIRYWKKGTLHLYFKDEELWQRFNREAALGKGWLPYNPEQPPVPKTKPSECAAMNDLLALAEARREAAMNLPSRPTA